MITINKVIEVTADAPYTFEWIVNGCDVDVTPLTGSQTGMFVNSTFVFADADDIETCDIDLVITDVAGCQQSFDIPFTNPCANFTGAINNTIGFFFVAQVTGGNGNPGTYTYEWTFDSNVWTDPIYGIATVILKPLPGASGTTTIYVTVTDNLGCELSLSYDYTFCEPAFSSFDSVGIPCNPSNSSGYGNGSINLNDFSIPCSGDDIDWDTFTLTGIEINGAPVPTASWNIVNTNGVIFIQPLVNLNEGIYRFYFNVASENGVVSDTYNFVVILSPDCEPGDDPTVLLQTCDCNIVLCDPPESGTINLDDCIVNGTVDPSSVTIDPMTPFILGNDATYNPATNEITYTANNQGSGSDQVWITLNTDTGAQSPVVTVSIITNCTPDNTPPVAMADDVCVNAGDTQVTFDVTTNDTGDYLDPTTVVITVNPLLGTASVGADGQITYIPNSPPLNQPDQLTYIVYNAGQVAASNPATVNIYGAYAGDYNNLAVCNDGCGLTSGIFDITRLNPNATAGGTYTALGYNTPVEGFDGDNTNTLQVMAADPASPPVGWPGNGNIMGGIPPLLGVDGASEGFYFFTYAVTPNPGCTHTRMFVLQIIRQPEAGSGGNFFLCIPETGSDPVQTITTAIFGEDAPGVNDFDAFACIPPVGVACSQINFDAGAGTIQVDSSTPQGEYQFTYTVENYPQTTGMYPFTMIQECTSPLACSDTTTVTATVVTPTNLGLAVNYETCETSINLLTLFDILNGGTGGPSVVDPAGTWIIGSAPGFPVSLGASNPSLNQGDVVQTGPNPVVDFTGAALGDYVFAYRSGTVPCEDVGTLTITLTEPLSPGITNANTSFCCTQFTDAAMTIPCVSCSYTLFNSLSFYDAGGVWAFENGPPNNNVGASLDTTAGTVDFCGEPSGQYVFRYTHNATSTGCAEVFTRVLLDVYDNTPIEIDIEVCNNVGSTLMNSFLPPYDNLSVTGTPQGNFVYDSGPAPGGSYNFDTDGDPTNDTVDPSAMGNGSHVIIFTDTSVGGGCSRTVTVNMEIIGAGGVAGGNGTVTACQYDANGDPTQLSLFTYLTGTPLTGGAWTETTVEPPDDYETQGGTIGATDQGLISLETPGGTAINAGVYEFTYSVNTPCGVDTATVTVTVTPVPIINLCRAGFVPCTYTLQAWNTARTIQNQVDVFVDAVDGISGEATYQCELHSTCAATNPITQTQTTDTLVQYFSKTVYNVFPLEATGYIDTLRVYRSDTDAAVDLDLSPTGANLLAPNVITVADLYYPGPGATATQLNNYRTALQNTILNALNNQIDPAYTYGTAFYPLVDPEQNGFNGVVGITFQCKNNPTGIWVGFKGNSTVESGTLYQMEYFRTDGGISPAPATPNANINNNQTGGVLNCQHSAPCGLLSARLDPVAPFITWTLAYNSITPSAGTLNVDLNPLNAASVTQLTCLELPVLQANVTGCTPETTPPPDGYQWYFNGSPIPGETTNQLATFDVALPGGDTYAVVVTCTNGCIASAETVCNDAGICSPGIADC